MAEEKVAKIEKVRPPNPFDFSSICEFLEQVLSMGDIIDEYSRICALIEQKENAEEGQARKGKIKIQVFDEDQFDEALVKTFIVLSAGLIKFKSLSPHEQDVKRDFLAKGNDTSLRNALAGAGFPDNFGKVILAKKYEELKPFKLGKAVLKANSVFDRAFYFTLKDTELTKKPIEELVTAIRNLEEADDLRQYLEALLYKIEVASTEKSFNNLKKMVAAPMSEIQKNTEKEFEDLQEGKYAEGKGPYSKEKMEEQLNLLQEKVEILNDYNGEFFCSEDFIYVEKNLLQFKKAKAEQQDHNNKEILSDEYIAGIDKKLMIQLISAFKKCYNVGELSLLKAFMLNDLVGSEGAMTETGEPTSRFTTKKNLCLESLKRIRTDMIVEDTFTTATNNKKTFIEAFEKELLQLGPRQLKDNLLGQAMKKCEDLLARAKRAMGKKGEDREAALEEARKTQQEIDELGCKTVGAIMDLYIYNVGKIKTKNFQAYLPLLEPHTKNLESVVKKIEENGTREEKKKMISDYFVSFQKKTLAGTALNKEAQRMFQMYMKGLVDRVKYW